MNVPILRFSFPEESRAYISAGVDEVIRSGIFTSGRFTRQFEEMFGAFSGAQHAIACSSGTSALELILRGLGVEGRSVIVPTNTFLATALAAMHAGNRVIFADSEPTTLALDVSDVRRRIESDTAAVILVHVGGIISPALHQLQQLCQERGLYLIEDAAHAHGCSIDGRAAGTLGIAGAFSFFPTKVLTTGEGGVITTDDEGLAAELRMLRNHGKNPSLGGHISSFGYNHRMSELTAVIGVDQMKRAARLIEERRRVAASYDTRLQGMAGLQPVKLGANVVSTYYKYVVYLDEWTDRAAVKSELKDSHGVTLTGEVYADLCHTEPLWSSVTYCGRRHDRGEVACPRWSSCGCGERQGAFPGAEFVSRHHACLPIYPDLTEKELEHVAVSLERVLAKAVTR
jgi:perosamine synthetase